MSSGLVIKNTGSWYYVEDSAEGEVITCKIKGKFRLKDVRTTNPITVGDFVDYETDDAGSHLITRVLDRKNYIIRRSSNLSREAHIIAANLDMAFVVATLDYPKTSFEFIDRFLVTAEAYNVPAVIILNKSDIYGEEYRDELDYFLYTYQTAGYEIIEVSATEDFNIDRLKELTIGKTTLFSGNSGVGKSSLIKAIDPSLNPKTGEISAYHKKGKHTTTFSEMYPLAEGGYIIDTPGIKGFGLVEFDKNEISRFFPEIFRYSPDCQYYNCTHVHEPGCAVIKAVQEGQISDSRYISYLKLLEDDNDKYRK